MKPFELPAPPVASFDPPWRSLYYFNAYRLVVALLLLATVAVFGDALTFGSRNLPIFVSVCSGYLVFAIGCFALLDSRQPSFHVQLAFQVSGDILCVVLLTYASGGIGSGLVLLLLVSLARAGLIGRGRMALFHAATASIAVLLEQAYEALYLGAGMAHFVQAGFVSIGYFATAWLARTYARHSAATEQLAEQRGIDLANLAQVNQLVIQDMQDGVVVVDEAGTIRQHNAQAEALLGIVLRRETALAECAPALAERLERWQRDGAPPEPLRIESSHKSVGIRVVPVAARGAVIFLEDLSRVQAQARQLKFAALGRLTANIAHEIRNPLSAIRHATELLQEDAAGDDTSARLLRIIHDNTGRLERMVQDVLRANRRDPAHRESFRVGEFLPVFVGQFSQIERIPPSIFSIEVEQDATVTFDRSHLNQVLWNLCRNALRYCRRQAGSVRLILRGGPDYPTLHVRDDGPGVEPALRSQLFEPFFTTAASGTGLGLYIAREVCDFNGAALDYVDEAQGGHFIIIFRGSE